MRGCGYVQSGVGSLIPIFVSTTQLDSGGASKAMLIPGLQEDPCISLKARSSVLPTNAQLASRKKCRTVSSWIVSRTAVSTSDGPGTPKPAGPKSSLHAFITKRLRKQGLHQSVQRFIPIETVNSSCQVYDAKLTMFETWCQCFRCGVKMSTLHYT